MDNNTQTQEIYNKNLEVLSRRYKTEYEILTQKPELLKEDKVEPFFDENGFLCAKDGDTCFRLESAYDSEKYLSIWIDKIKRNPNISSKLIMFGLGNGMFARKYIEEMPKGYEIIIYEPLHSVFDFVLNHYDISELLDSNRVALYVDGIGIAKDFNNFMSDKIKLQDVKTVIVDIYENYGNLYMDRLSDFIDSVNICLRGVFLDSNFLAKFSTLINENIEKNMRHYVNTLSITNLDGKAKDIPAVIVGAGPSLDHNVDKLADIKGKAVIIATDSAVRTLARKNIAPDIIVTMDPIKDGTYLAGDICKGIPLISSLHSGWGLVDAHEGPCFFTNSMDRMTNEFSTSRGIFVQSLKSSGSVAHLAFSTAQFMKCFPIIFIGMDLAYPGNQSHCADSVVASVTVEELQGDIIVKDIFGNDVATSADMQRYRLWIENEIAKFPESKYIDATEGGALINGTDILELKDVINLYCNKEYDIAGIFDSAGYVYEGELKQELIEYLSETPAHMRDNIARLDKLEPMYKKMLDMINSGVFSRAELVDIQKKANKILDEIETDPLSDFTNNFVQDERNRLFGDINVADQDEISNITETLRIGMEYFTALRKAIDEGLPYAERMVASINNSKE